MGAELLIELALLALAFAAGWLLRGGTPDRADVPTSSREDDRELRVDVEREPHERDDAMDALLQEAASALEDAIGSYHAMISTSGDGTVGDSVRRKASETLTEPVARLGRAADRISSSPAGNDELLRSLGRSAVELADVNGRLVYGRVESGLDELLDRLEQTLASTASALSALGKPEGARTRLEPNGQSPDTAALRIGAAG